MGSRGEASWVQHLEAMHPGTDASLEAVFLLFPLRHSPRLTCLASLRYPFPQVLRLSPAALPGTATTNPQGPHWSVPAGLSPPTLTFTGVTKGCSSFKSF